MTLPLPLLRPDIIFSADTLHRRIEDKYEKKKEDDEINTYHYQKPSN
jgi:hypothetical protein